MKKFVLTTLYWAIGFCLFLTVIAYIQKPSSRLSGTDCCKKLDKVEPSRGGELLLESLSRQFVSTVSVY